jgi:hypothetical protein
MTGESFVFDPPPMTVSVPDAVEWHMIFDHELTQLSRTEMGVVGSFGFVALGTALGLLPSFIGAFEKANGKDVMTAFDAAVIFVFAASAALTIICLLLAGIDLWRNRGLADKIRRRTKHGLSTSSSAETL